MLCPSCGKSVGEVMQLCEECAELKRASDELRAKEEEERRAAIAESRKEEQPEVAANENASSVVDGSLAGVDLDEGQILLVKAIAVAIFVLFVLLIVLLIFS